MVLARERLYEVVLKRTKPSALEQYHAIIMVSAMIPQAFAGVEQVGVTMIAQRKHRRATKSSM
jgi:hypothetical protein